MPDKHGGSTPEQYEETTSPANPPNATAVPAAAVVGMWYYLAPVALVIGLALMALFYWVDRDNTRDDLVEPTTGISDESTPGGNNPDPTPSDTAEEIEFRGNTRQP